MKLLPVVSMSTLATRFVKVQAYSEENGVEQVPISFPAYMAFPIQGVAPSGGDWKAATWEVTPNSYLVRVSVGPGGSFIPIAGRYDIWVKVVSPSETPVERVGVLAVT
jgi:hypothetical protein